MREYKLHKEIQDWVDKQVKKYPKEIIFEDLKKEYGGKGFDVSPDGKRLTPSLETVLDMPHTYESTHPIARDEMLREYYSSMIKE